MGNYSQKELYEISGYLNKLPYLVFISLAAHFFPPFLIISGLICFLYSHRLSKAEKSSKPWLWGIFSVLPIVGFIAIFVLVYKAVEILRENGIEAGFWGVKKSDREALLNNGE